MFNKLWNWLKKPESKPESKSKSKSKSKPKSKSKSKSKSKYISPSLINDQTYFSFNQVENPQESNALKPRSILLMDDISNQFDLYDIDFRRIKEKYNFDVHEHYNIIKCEGDFAGFIAWKYLVLNQVNIAILDITLGKSAKLENGDYIAFDGIDIGLMLDRQHNTTDYKFCTAHPLNRQNREIHSFIDKFENISGHNIQDFYFNKNDDRFEIIYKMIIKDLDKDNINIQELETQNN